MQNYEKLFERISRVSGLTKEEIERRVEAKRAKLSGLISKEGAAQVVAAELGISFDKEKLKIDELLPGMKKVNLVGKVINIFPVREFNKNGKQGKVANFIIADETSNIKVVLWDINHISLIEENKLTENNVIEILNASMRDNELHLGSFSELKISKEILNEVKTQTKSRERKISELSISDNIKIRAFIVQMFDPKFFNVCSQCKKKINEQDGNFFCNDHGSVIPEKRALVNIVIDDGTSNIKTVLFNDALNSIEYDSDGDIGKQKQHFIGKEYVFYGNVRKNKLYGTLEFVVSRVEEINLQELIAELER